MVRLYLSDNQVDAAAELLSKPETSPIEIVTAEADAIPMRIAMDTQQHPTEISELASGKISMDVATKKMAEVHQTSLKPLPKENGDGVQTLAGIYVQLARNLADCCRPRKRLRELNWPSGIRDCDVLAKKATAFNIL